MHTEVLGATGGAGVRRCLVEQEPRHQERHPQHPRFNAVLQTLQQTLGFPPELLTEQAGRWDSPWPCGEGSADTSCLLLETRLPAARWCQRQVLRSGSLS